MSVQVLEPMTGVAAAAGPPAERARKGSLAWLGVVPFFAFAILFLIAPTFYLVVGAFQDPTGSFTLANIAGLFQSQIVAAYWISIRISLASAGLGALLGFFLAYAIVHGGLPSWIRSSVVTFSGVASNFAGIPLAFAFLATLGRIGLVTWFLNEAFGLNIYRLGFNLLSFWGLTITYLYFQIPLMVLIITPALDGLKREWREASSILGASNWQYWRMVALPVLFPSLMGCFLLLFANAFGAIATAYALTGSSLNIVPILLYAQIRGDVLYNPNLGYALAFGMIVITGCSNLLYIWLRSRAERWLR
ncbi:putative spermidine/putrescine transport system permease protein [Aureimonas phyllosphaerae]|uniref:Putative spermidine/putrescine transport system permease protein n=2 Tax=Aureimonas phyllosphaerae TaxID=1166078 RepID=A0A7W6BVJ4_9HYPH|nr:putative spermidine/putrescine transport system permease protein [Aureimonas phyllosphaerae]MBB3961006.1 putative spermidine/putrescine transport system permease protein [Aureimonas phyllosphaerae]SFF26973.1 putative spermidine/putrescine transport system permease protein [Aureimonas phyllosphaerae]